MRIGRRYQPLPVLQYEKTDRKLQAMQITLFLLLLSPSKIFVLLVSVFIVL